MMYHIFISYRRSSGAGLAYIINERLTNLGYSVFLDISSLSNGRFDEKIFSIIDECGFFLLIMTLDCFNRCNDEDDWVRKEVEYAISRNKIIIPIIAPEFEFPETLPERMNSLRFINGIAVNFFNFDEFIERVERRLTSDDVVLSMHEDPSDIKQVYMWCDFDIGYQYKIIKKLNLGEKYNIDVIADPIEILIKNLQYVYAILLIDTDVTKLSASYSTNKLINDRLKQYVSNGGKLLCTHDLVYRRTKNEALQEMYGCRITEFLRSADPIKYQKTDECREKGAFLSLPDAFDLHDNEICWGKLAPDVDLFFSTPDGIPLVFGREYGMGYCLYFNSGDFSEYPSPSISKPEEHFISLLREAIITEFDNN